MDTDNFVFFLFFFCAIAVFIFGAITYFVFSKKVNISSETKKEKIMHGLIYMVFYAEIGIAFCMLFADFIRNIDTIIEITQTCNAGCLSEVNSFFVPFFGKMTVLLVILFFSIYKDKQKQLV